MKYLYDLKDMLEDEIEEIAKKGELNAVDLDTAHKLTDTVKNIYKICMLADGESDDYSRDGGNWQAMGEYGRGNSYARRGGYSRDNYSQRRTRDGRGRYSRNYSMAGEDMAEHLRSMLESAEGKEKTIIKRALDELEAM